MNQYKITPTRIMNLISFNMLSRFVAVAVFALFSAAILWPANSHAQTADIVVWQDDDGLYLADCRTRGVIFSSTAIDETIQFAVDNLTPGRTVKERVTVLASGIVERSIDRNGPVDVIRIHDSYTVLDIQGTLTMQVVETPGEGERLNKRVVLKARNVTHVEIPNINVKGVIDWGIKLESVSHARIGHANFELESGFPIRIDNQGSGGVRSTDIQVDSVFINGATHHGLETRGVDRIQVGRVMARDIDGCVVLFNDTNNATVESVMGYNPNSTSSYATFRVTAHDHGRITVGQVVSIDSQRGIHIHTGSGEIVINNVYIEGARTRGIVISSSENVVINGGIIKNSHGHAIDVFTFDRVGQPDRIARNITITNMRIYDDRPEGARTQTSGINFGADSGIVANNDLRNAGDVLLSVSHPDVLVRDNLGAGVAQGSVTLQTGESPAARVEGVSPFREATLDLRARAANAPDATFSWNHYFEFNADRNEWDLVIDWRTDPGEDIELDYIVDQPQVVLH